MKNYKNKFVLIILAWLVVESLAVYLMLDGASFSATSPRTSTNLLIGTLSAILTGLVILFAGYLAFYAGGQYTDWRRGSPNRNTTHLSSPGDDNTPGQPPPDEKVKHGD